MDLAVLGIEIDSRSAVRAASDLDKLESAGRRAEGVADRLQRSFDRLNRVLGVLGLGIAVKGITDTITQFERLKGMLETATGSMIAANAEFQKLEKFASSTPFALEESVNAFIKLKNLGLDPSEKALQSYGNTAAAMGKSLNQMIEAVADATVGEMERLKEFGIRAQQQGDTVRFTFQGITTEVAKNAQEIEGYLRSIGDVNFAGAMEKQMERLPGLISNLGDSFSGLFRAIGDAGATKALENAIKVAISVVETLRDNLEILAITAGLVAAAFTGKIVVALIAATQRIIATTSATIALQSAMAFFGGPIGLAISAVAGSFFLLSTQTSKSAEAADIARQANEELNRILGDTKNLTKEAAQAALDKAGADLKQAEAALAAAAAEAEKRRAFSDLVSGSQGQLGSTADVIAFANEGKVAKLQERVEALRATLGNANVQLKDLLDGSGGSNGNGNGGGNSPTAEQLKKAAAEAERFAKALESTMDSLDPVGAAVSEYLDTLELLSKALKQNNITQGEFNRLEAAAREAMEATTEPAKALIKSLEDEYKLMQLSDRERAIAIELRKLDADATQGQIQAVRDLAGAMFDAEQATRNVTQAAEPMAQVFEDAATAINNSFVDLFRGIFDKGMDSFKDLTRSILDLFKETLARMAAMALARPILVPIISGLGSALGVSGTAQANVLTQLGLGGAQQAGGFFGGGGLPFGPERISSLGLPTGISEFLASSSFATNPLLSGAGGFGGNFLANTIFGRSTTGGNIGGTIGAIGGSFLPLPPGLGTAVGAFIGNVIGDFVGGLFSSNDFKANLGSALDKHSPALRGTASDVIAESAFGFIGFERSKDFASRDYAEPLQAIAQLDNLLAQSLLPDQIDKIRTALDGWVSSTEKGTINLERLAKERLGRALEGLGGNFLQLAERIQDMDLETAYQTVAAFVEIEKSLASLEDSINALSATAQSGADQIRAAASAMDASVNQAMDSLKAAIDAGDFAQIAIAAQQAHQLVIERYNTEIALATELNNRLEELKRAASDFTIGIEGRIARILGGSGERLALEARGGDLARQYTATTDPNQRLALLQEGVTLIDALLSAGVSEIERNLQDALTALNEQTQAQVDAVNASIRGLEEQRRAIQENHRTRIESLQEELQITQQWTGVLQSARRMLEQMQLTRSSPLPTLARLDVAGEMVEQLQAQFAQASPEDRPELANRLLEALNAQLSLAQEAYQRPSPEYQALYNEIVKQVSELEGVAQTEAERAMNLQEEIKRIQERSEMQLRSIDSQIENLRQEAQRIQDQAAVQAERLQAQASADIKAFEAQMVGYLKAIEADGSALFAALVGNAQAELDALTQGLSVDQFIAQKQAEAVDLLRQIRDAVAGGVGISDPTTSPTTSTPSISPSPGADPFDTGRLTSIYSGGVMSDDQAFALAETAKAMGMTSKQLEQFFGWPGGTVQAFLEKFNLPSFAVGSRFIPEDMVAQIHQGERILTAEDNRRFGPMLDQMKHRPQGQQASTQVSVEGINITVPITVSGGGNPAEVARAVERKLGEKLPAMVKKIVLTDLPTALNRKLRTS